MVDLDGAFRELVRRRPRILHWSRRGQTQRAALLGYLFTRQTLAAPLHWDGTLTDYETRLANESIDRYIHEHFKRIVYENSEHLFPKPG